MSNQNEISAYAVAAATGEVASLAPLVSPCGLPLAGSLARPSAPVVA